jgi:hypothetical protein
VVEKVVESGKAVKRITIQACAGTQSQHEADHRHLTAGTVASKGGGIERPWRAGAGRGRWRWIMAGRQAPLDRGDARQRIDARSGRAAPGQVPGGASGFSGRFNGHVRFGVELMIGWVAVWVIVAAIVAYANTISPAVVPDQDMPLIEQWQPEITGDPEHPGPPDTLLFCTADATHTHCIREAS